VGGFEGHRDARRGPQGPARPRDIRHGVGDAIESHRPDWILYAGFMRIVGEKFVDRFRGKLVNIHPSLLPSFPGLHTHRRALEAGVKIHGATVHFVTAALDSGPILIQAAVPVVAGDTEASLARACSRRSTASIRRRLAG
jgi:formyltetrahydrofolate-dependent phosphoribosylglycinamide formyltransferase